MRLVFFSRIRLAACGIALLAGVSSATAESSHGIAMYGVPALPPGFTALPYVNPDAPKGGTIVFGNLGSFDSVNPFVVKGTPPWQLRFWAYESLMGRSYDEPFSLYGLLAESIETPEDRSWVEFTLRPEATFSDGTPVTVEDVIWSYETLGTEGNLRYRGFWTKIDKIEQTGPRSLRLTFNDTDRELALIAGLRPVLKKQQWDGVAFADADPSEVPIGTAPYIVSDFELGRSITFSRDPDYWGNSLALRRGTNNFDEMRLEYFGDQTVLFEAFKAGELSAVREFNAAKWETDYSFARVQDGAVVKTEIPDQTPSGMTGLVMNTRRAPLDDWRVRQALIEAFNFEFINDTLTGGNLPRITSYFSNSYLAMGSGAATGRVLELLEPFKDTLLPGAIEGYELPVSDGSERNRENLRRARASLEEAGWTISDGRLRNADGEPLELRVLLQHGNLGEEEMQKAVEIYAKALERLGISLTTELVDGAQYVERQDTYDFDLTFFRRALSLSPGNEQMLYWGSEGADAPGSRNLMGMNSPAAEAMIRHMLTTSSSEEFQAATRGLDRILTSGRYVIPIWQYATSRIAHDANMKLPESLPIYGDGIHFMPEVWWSAAD
ncbi:extracellular solute-binding protein [Tritonibacter horizontis]|uniref:Nickel-binding periplasmic protein n=1 Tax=Tritonibacter horizontis TaxID=1768241 RepID=A0A132BW07_9RHOB|nr:extracellular solute-binding protein [Tritonibacter horizontis]KUP92568.1 nickel-binding periplasmic protein precursor [Tritonibacter horizontis]